MKSDDSPVSAEDCAADLESVKRILQSLKRKFDLKVGAVEKHSWGAAFVMKNRTSGVRVKKEMSDRNFLYVTIARLIDGDIPPEPTFIYDHTVLHGFDIGYIASLRLDRLPKTLQRKMRDDIEITSRVRFNRISASLANKLRDHTQLTPQDVETILMKCCDDILAGDFSVFEEASRIVKEDANRIAKDYPETRPDPPDNSTY